MWRRYFLSMAVYFIISFIHCAIFRVPPPSLSLWTIVKFVRYGTFMPGIDCQAIAHNTRQSYIMFNCNGCDIAPAPTIHLVVVAVRSFILRFLISLSWFERNFTRVVKWTKIFSQMTNIMLFTYSQQLLHVAHYSRQIRFCIKSICSNNNNTQVRRRREEKTNVTKSKICMHEGNPMTVISIYITSS